MIHTVKGTIALTRGIINSTETPERKQLELQATVAELLAYQCEALDRDAKARGIARRD